MSKRAANTDGEHATIRHTAKLKGLGERWLRRAVARGDLKLYRPPGAWPRLRLAEVDALMQRYATRATSQAEARVREVLEREERTAKP